MSLNRPPRLAAVDVRGEGADAEAAGFLKDGVAAFVASVGKGKLYAFGPEITFRGQTWGTFKLLFNQLYQ